MEVEINMSHKEPYEMSSKTKWQEKIKLLPVFGLNPDFDLRFTYSQNDIFFISKLKTTNKSTLRERRQRAHLY